MGLLQKIRGEMETKRLLLRRWEKEDFKAYSSFMSQPEVMIPAGAEPLQTLDRAMALFRRDMRNDSCFAIVLKETNEVIGRITFQSDMRRFNVKSLSVGYELRRESWGMGYMPEALCAMIKRAFEKEKVDVLGISHFAANQRSCRVIEKCGFQYEGTIHHGTRRMDGAVMDDVCYCILREEYPAWKARYGERPDKLMLE